MRVIGVDSKRMNPRGLASPRVRIRLRLRATGWVRRLYHTPYLSIQPPSSRRCGKREPTVTRGPLDGSQYNNQPCSQSVLMVDSCESACSTRSAREYGYQLRNQPAGCSISLGTRSSDLEYHVCGGDVPLHLQSTLAEIRDSRGRCKRGPCKGVSDEEKETSTRAMMAPMREKPQVCP